jgi:hypothetical protein
MRCYYYVFSVLLSPSLVSASLVITIGTFCYYGRTIGLVFSIYDSTEAAIQKMIESCESIIDEEHNSSVVNRDFKLKIKTLQNAPRDPDKLERLLKLKEREKEEKAMDIKDVERLVTEIEMLRVVLYLVCRNNRRN